MKNVGPGTQPHLLTPGPLEGKVFDLCVFFFQERNSHIERLLSVLQTQEFRP